MFGIRRLPLVLVGLAPLATAQEIVPLVARGDTLPGADGPVLNFNETTLGQAGEWFQSYSVVGLPTTLLRGGHVVMKTGGPVPNLPGHTISFSTTPRSNEGGSTVQTIQWSDPQGFSGRGLFFDDSLLLQDGDPIPGTSPQAAHLSFLAPRINDVGDVLFIASGTQPGQSNYYALVLLTGAGAPNPTQTIVHERGEVLPGQTATLLSFFASSFVDGAWADDGRALWAGTLSDGKVVVYLTDTTTGVATLIAEEGGPSPHPGRPWKNLQNPTMDLIASGDWVLHGYLEGGGSTNEVIVKNGAILLQEGDAHPALPPGFALVDFGPGPLDLDDAGRLLWYGRWNDPDFTQDAGLFLDDTLLVQKGVTQIDGATLTGIGTDERAYGISGDGRFVAFQGSLSDGTYRVFLIDLDPASSYCSAKPNSLGCAPQIGFRGVASAASTVDFDVAATNVLNQKPGLLFFGFGSANVPFHGGTLCVQPPLARTSIQTSGGNPPPLDCSGGYTLDFNALIQGGVYPQLTAGADVFAQWWMRDPANGAGSAGTALSEGLTTTIAP